MRPSVSVPDAEVERHGETKPFEMMPSVDGAKPQWTSSDRIQRRAIEAHVGDDHRVHAVDGLYRLLNEDFAAPYRQLVGEWIRLCSNAPTFDPNEQSSPLPAHRGDGCGCGGKCAPCAKTTQMVLQAGRVQAGFSLAPYAMFDVGASISSGRVLSNDLLSHGGSHGGKTRNACQTFDALCDVLRREYYYWIDMLQYLDMMVECSGAAYLVCEQRQWSQIGPCIALQQRLDEITRQVSRIEMSEPVSPTRNRWVESLGQTQARIDLDECNAQIHDRSQDTPQRRLECEWRYGQWGLARGLRDQARRWWGEGTGGRRGVADRLYWQQRDLNSGLSTDSTCGPCDIFEGPRPPPNFPVAPPGLCPVPYDRYRRPRSI